MKKIRLPGLLTLLLVVAALTAWISTFPRPTAASPDKTSSLPAGTFVARVYYDDIADIQRLSDYDVWEFNNLDEQYVLVALDAPAFAGLAQAGWRLAVDQQATATLRPAAWQRPFYGEYRTVDELYADLSATAVAHPAIATLFEYGSSYCRQEGGCETLGGEIQPGYPLLAMRVTNPTLGDASEISDGVLVGGSKPVFFLMANIHAREITTPELAMRMLDWLVNGYGSDPNATWLVDWHEIWLVPTANPDGHWLVQLGEQPPYSASPFYQRKNANNDTDNNGLPDCSIWPPTSGGQYGVDLNRNHSFRFGGSGSSGVPCSPTFRGPSPASEPEVAALQALVETLIPDQRGPNPDDAAPIVTQGLLITLHSYSRLVLYPWGYTAAPAPNNAGLATIARKLASYNGYRPCQPSLCLYAADGTTDDWAYGELGVPAFTFEIGTQFMPPYAEIDAEQWPLNGPALQTAARLAREPYSQIQGPDVVSLTVEPESDGAVRITAVLDTTDMQTASVTAASVTVDMPFWAGGSTAALAPVDGSFGDPRETVTAVVDTSALSDGRHLLLVQGQGDTGHIGPTLAVFLDLQTPFSTYLPFMTKH